jgi:hypothetical protein
LVVLGGVEDEFAEELAVDAHGDATGVVDAVVADSVVGVGPGAWGCFGSAVAWVARCSRER